MNGVQTALFVMVALPVSVGVFIGSSFGIGCVFRKAAAMATDNEFATAAAFMAGWFVPSALYLAFVVQP